MDQAHPSLKLSAQDLQPTQLQALLFPLHNPRVDMADTQVISNRDFTVAKLAANMLVLRVPVVIKLADKVTKTANTEVTKLSEATTMAIANNVVDGAATMDINRPLEVATRPW